MLEIKNITLKNFMSTGKVTQSVDFESADLFLVLGENMDLGGNDNRNGVGKSALVNAVSYALYGSAITNIKKNNLVNKTNGKEMQVTLVFEKNGVEYTIKRGRKPAILEFLVDGDPLKEDNTDENQGDSRVTQKDIEDIVGMSHTMFKNIVALNTYSQPFFSMKASEQRDFIEQLLGITKLSEKAENLKEILKNTKEEIRDEESNINATKRANESIENNIESLKRKSNAWERSHDKKLKETTEAFNTLKNINVDDEIRKHKENSIIKEQISEWNDISNNISRLEKEIVKLDKDLDKKNNKIQKVNDQQCYACGQKLEDHDHVSMLRDLEKEKQEKQKEINKKANELETIIKHKETLNEPPNLYETFYDSADEAYEHKSSMSSIENMLESEEKQSNPYVDQIDSLQQEGIQKIDYSNINKLYEIKEHQEFLLKLLTSKDSFIRKKIIDQNISFLNKRLSHYLREMNLPHSVRFLSDLTVEITELGRDLDFDNLSRGERTRLTLSLSWSFRDVYESLNDKIDILFIDELIDNGLDTSGVEAALHVVKDMVRKNNKRVLLISHRDELVGRVSDVLNVVKENGFTHFTTGDVNH